jgi:O-6-methylguanine DNA methyltransferase
MGNMNALEPGLNTGAETSAIESVSIGELRTPAGVFGAVFTERGLARLMFPAELFSGAETWVRRLAPGVRRIDDDPRVPQLQAELSAYFAGTLRTFSVPVHLIGSPFQVQVWEALQEIGYGELRTYAQIATAIGRPSAVRAVGAANGANPVPIVVPCHRVIGSNGTLTGYGGGLEMKALLLRTEGVMMGAL